MLRGLLTGEQPADEQKNGGGDQQKADGPHDDQVSDPENQHRAANQQPEGTKPASHANAASDTNARKIEDTEVAEPKSIASLTTDGGKPGVLSITDSSDATGDAAGGTTTDD